MGLAERGRARQGEAGRGRARRLGEDFVFKIRIWREAEGELEALLVTGEFCRRLNVGEVLEHVLVSLLDFLGEDHIILEDLKGKRKCAAWGCVGRDGADVHERDMRACGWGTWGWRREMVTVEREVVRVTWRGLELWWAAGDAVRGLSEEKGVGGKHGKLWQGG